MLSDSLSDSEKVKVFILKVKVSDMDLTMAEKRDLIERIIELAKIDVLKKEDRDDIYRVCLVACDREMAKMRKEQ